MPLDDNIYDLFPVHAASNACLPTACEGLQQTL